MTALATLATRWQGRDRFVVLATGFGTGDVFLATWDAWRRDPQRCDSLCFIAIEPTPATHGELANAHTGSSLAHLVEPMLAAWPPLTPDLHRLDFEHGKLQLLLAVGDANTWLPELVAAVDAFFIDTTSTTTNGTRDLRFCKALGRLATPEATLEAGIDAPSFRAGLATAGFEVQSAPGITRARYAPTFQPRRPVGRAVASPANDRRVLIVGAGLAGCAAASALAEFGWHSTLIERRDGLAKEGSGNPAGLFHGIVNAQDGLHARFNRAAALSASAAVQAAISVHAVQGSAAGLLRLETVMPHAQMQQVLHTLALPTTYVQAVSAAEAGTLCDMPLPHPAWFYPGGGWVQPAALASAYVKRAAGHSTLRGGVEVQALRFSAGQWQVLDAQGRVIDAAPALLLANAGEALRLLGAHGWPIEKLRGQISIAPTTAFGPPGSPGRTRLPVAGAGYLLPDVNGHVMFGATVQPLDDDASVREADHRSNLTQLERLTGHASALDPSTLDGRTAWRWSSRDRLPVIGAVPVMPGMDFGQALLTAPHRPTDQPRFVPRIPGLFVFTALGSRGITWSALGGQVVASAITGAPAPLGASLLDAIDPARFVTRELRRRRGA
ncbi:MAG: FAD-dependent 5-carboxymethylaminomethyl-2-thiouridine(34) oxidoreductase MnmC [Burkholderiaceae bacterium]